MAWSEAIAAMAEAAKKVMERVWGEQTSQESSLQQRAENAAKEKRQAKEDLRKANIDGDLPACADALARLNQWDGILKRLSSEAIAKRTP